jgi:hypothetical protein
MGMGDRRNGLRLNTERQVSGITFDVYRGNKRVMAEVK